MRAEGFASIPTWMIRDANVGIYALTVYAALSSRAGLREIIPGRDTLAREARCSVRQVARALEELEELGVVVRVRRKNSSGRAPNGYVLHPNGRVEVGDSQSLTSEVEDSETEVRDSHDRGMGLERHSAPLIGRDSEVDREEVDSAFESLLSGLWKFWPSSRRSSRKVVERSLRTALKVASAETLLSAAEAHSVVWRTWLESDHRFIPMLPTWLNQERWTTPAPERRGSTRPSTVDHGRAVDAILRERAAEAQRAVSA